MATTALEGIVQGLDIQREFHFAFVVNNVREIWKLGDEYMSFEAMQAEQNTSICFSCHTYIDQSKFTEIVTIDNIFGYTKKRILFHPDCFFADAGEVYKTALSIPQSAPIPHQFGPPTTMDSIKNDLNSAINKMTETQSLKMALEYEKKRQEELQFEHIRKQYQKLIETRIKATMYDMPTSWQIEAPKKTEK